VLNKDQQILNIKFYKYMILLNIFNWAVNLTMNQEAVTPLQQSAEIKNFKRRAGMDLHLKCRKITDKIIL